jgi:predicted AAA+ superfamily ATPase
MVDKRTLEFALSDQKEEMEEYAQETLCQRCEEQQIDLDSTQAQVVIGVRRSGKSTLCYQALRDKDVKYAYANFDDEQLIALKASDLNDVLEVLYKIYGDFNYLFLDEIQNIEGWHLFVNRLLRKKMHILLTGSNAKLLSGELATHLSGRSKEVSLFPFSFREYCTMKSVDTERRTTKAEAFRRAAFDDYLKQGGFPELLSISDGRSYVSNLVDNILKRDIEQRHRITFKAAFENMANHLLNNAPTVVVTKDLAGTFGFKSEHTVKNYMDFLKQAYLLVGLQKYSQKSKQRMTQEKVYAIDVAMMNQRENAFSGDNWGHRLETTVFIHLLRKCKIEGWDVYYLNERSGECDFVVCQGNKVLQCIQVSYDISVEKTRKREVAGAVLAAERTRCGNLLLLTDHDSDTINERGHIIKVQPVYEWALELGV